MYISIDIHIYLHIFVYSYLTIYLSPVMHKDTTLKTHQRNTVHAYAHNPIVTEIIFIMVGESQKHLEDIEQFIFKFSLETSEIV